MLWVGSLVLLSCIALLDLDLCSGDLIKILEKLWAKRASLDYILIESTGLADPCASSAFAFRAELSLCRAG